MIELDRSEAIRYMGYHGTQPDEAVQASLTRCGEALQQAAATKVDLPRVSAAAY